jgi:hypothetical protein
MAERVSLDTDEATAVAAAWRDYGDRVEQHGAADPHSLAQLRTGLGDIYADFVDAKVIEQQERAAAYQRVAAQSRLHADHLERTVRTFDEQDAANSVPLTALDQD